MAKVLEGPGMGLMKKWGITVPNYVVVTSVDELAKLGQANEWLKKSKLVVKAHEALGSRFKLGLVKVDLDLKGAEAATKEMIGRQVGSITVSQVIVSEMIPHKEEFYCAVKSTRAGTDILVANCGGIEVESNWDRVKRLAVEVGQQPSADVIEKLAKDAGFTGPLLKKMADFAGKMFTCFDCEDAQYLEVNPVVLREQDSELIALDAVTLLDGDANFYTPIKLCLCRRIRPCLFQARNGSHGGRFKDQRLGQIYRNSRWGYSHASSWRRRQHLLFRCGRRTRWQVGQLRRIFRRSTRLGGRSVDG
jgi:ATP-citrate lyase beta-subunit